VKAPGIFGLNDTTETTDVFESDFTGQVFTLDWREYLALGKQNVFAVRFVQGWGTGRPRVLTK